MANFEGFHNTVNWIVHPDEVGVPHGRARVDSFGVLVKSVFPGKGWVA